MSPSTTPRLLSRIELFRATPSFGVAISDSMCQSVCPISCMSPGCPPVTEINSSVNKTVSTPTPMTDHRSDRYRSCRSKIECCSARDSLKLMCSLLAHVLIPSINVVGLAEKVVCISDVVVLAHRLSPRMSESTLAFAVVN